MRSPEGLAVTRLREVLDYDPATGVFTWKSTLSARRSAGATAGGSGCKGYWRISVDGRRYLAHRIAWAWMTGAWPTQDIDHIDGHRCNNRFCNLREASQVQNNGNSRLRKDSTSGLKGVSWHKRAKKWAAYAGGRGTRVHLGLFESREEAHEAYLVHASLLFGEFVRRA